MSDQLGFEVTKNNNNQSASLTTVWVCVGIEEECSDVPCHLKWAPSYLEVCLLQHLFENGKPRGFKSSPSLITNYHHWALLAGEFNGYRHQVSVLLCTKIG